MERSPRKKVKKKKAKKMKEKKYCSGPVRNYIFKRSYDPLGQDAI
jgi:hypothetical protein